MGEIRNQTSHDIIGIRSKKMNAYFFLFFTKAEGKKQRT